MGLVADVEITTGRSGLWLRRGLAAAIDSAVAILIVELILTAIGYKTLFHHGHGVPEIGARLLGLVAAALYYPAIMSTTNGRTLGKILTGVRVVRSDGRPMNLLRAGWREVIVKIALFGTLASLPVHRPYTALGTVGLCAFALDLLWPLWDTDNRALHDYLASTRVLCINDARKDKV